jgi:hypothetical protein
LSEKKEVTLDIARVYQVMFRITNRFVKMANEHSIYELKEKHDPTMEEIADDARELAKIMNHIADEKWGDERLALNAAQAALYMRRVAIAVRNSNEEVFNSALAELESHELV